VSIFRSLIAGGLKVSEHKLSGALKPEIKDYVPTDSDLNLAARDAIRSFVWKLIAPSAITLAVISGVELHPVPKTPS
jgi:flagellar biosynthesis component FlhA